MKLSMTAQKSGLMGVTPPQSAARNASARTTAITMMTVLLTLLTGMRSPQSGHSGTSWSKLAPQLGQVWRIGPPVPTGSSGIAGGYAERGEEGPVFSLRMLGQCQRAETARKCAKPPWKSLMDTCTNCDAPLPPPSPKGGRQRRFCSAECKNRWRYEVRLERENSKQRDEERIYMWDVEFYGREGADRRAARRRRRQDEAHGAT